MRDMEVAQAIHRSSGAGESLLMEFFDLGITLMPDHRETRLLRRHELIEVVSGGLWQITEKGERVAQILKSKKG